MGKFEQRIVNKFVPRIKRAYVVFDPEYRLEQGDVRSKLEKKGFSIIEYTPTPHFRYIYEKEFRQVWDNGSEKELIVVVRDKKNLPVDLESFYLVDLRAKKLLPSLPEVGSKIPSELLDTIYDEIANSDKILTDKEIFDLLIEKIACISKIVVNNEIDVLQFLLSLAKRDLLDMPFLREVTMSKIPDEYLKSLRIDANVLSSTNTFYEWLNSIWQDYAISVINGDKPQIDLSKLKTEISGLLSLGILSPIELKSIDIEEIWFKRWIRRKKLDVIEIIELRKELERTIDKHTEFNEWVSILKNISGMELRISDKDIKTLEEFLNFLDFLDQKFSKWYLSNIGGISNRSAYLRPWTIDQILDHLRMRYKNKICLVMVDSLSFFTWLLLKDFLVRNGITIIREEVVLTWIPTITNICRKSLLSGMKPIELTKVGHKPDDDLWYDFWGKFFESDKISYIKNGDVVSNVLEYDFSSREVVLITINEIDEIVHTSLSYQDLNGRLNQCFENLLLNLQRLSMMGFKIFITADHGFRRCKGREYHSKTIFINTKGCRFFISERKEKCTGIIINGKGYGFKEFEYIHLSCNSLTFSKSEKVFDHGGLTIQECFVPFIEISYKEGIK